MKHLTHLSGFASNLKVLHAIRTSTLRRLADACPTLTFIELRTLSEYDASNVWVTIKRRTGDGRYVGWNAVKSLRGTQMEDWSRHFDPSTSTSNSYSNSNWDKRIMTFKKSRRGRRPGQAFFARVFPGGQLRNCCPSMPFLEFVHFSLCAAIVAIFLVLCCSPRSQAIA